jgi:hypothetical protein
LAVSIEESLTYLDGLARHGRPARRQLKPGTVLVRDYQGQRHTVTVAPDGYLWQGTIYPSLSAIARAITGSAWSALVSSPCREPVTAPSANRRPVQNMAGIITGRPGAGMARNPRPG